MVDSKISRQQSANLAVLYNQAVVFHQRGNLTEAERLYLQFLSVEPLNFNALHLLGVVRFQQGRNAEALELIGAALKTNPESTDAFTNYGLVLRADRAFEKALTSFDNALALKPRSAEALNYRGNILRHLGRPEEALTSLDKALTFRPNYPEALINRGNTLLDMRRPQEALIDFNKALAIDPDYAVAYYNLGSVLCDSNRAEEGFAAFTHYAELVYGALGNAPQNNERTPPHKARHDREQHDYLTGPEFNDDALVTETMFRLADGSRLASQAVNPRGTIDETERQWRESQPQIVVIDDFLTNEALNKLRHFCLGSTIWRKVYSDGYLGAMPEHGLACPLLMQIAEELRTTYRAIFGGHSLRQMWAFKYDNELKGTNVHADFAAVNVNFWITPDEANLDPESGGLVIWDVAAPLDWNFAKFNNDSVRIRAFLASTGARSVTIPYRANRAVIFDSDLFHETDRMVFRNGYGNRRINVTFLYGLREAGDQSNST